MISFWISVVPPKMDRTSGTSLSRAFITVVRATAPNTGCSRSLASPAAWAADTVGHGPHARGAYWVEPQLACGVPEVCVACEPQ